MHTDYQELRNQVDQIWDELWTGGLSNPMDAIEQLSYLLFLKLMDDEEDLREKQARRRGIDYEPQIADELRWRTWTNYQAGEALAHLKDTVFPMLRNMGDEDSSFRRYMQNAECKINKASMLIRVTGMIDRLNISAQGQDVKGDIYEYLLSKLSTAGRNGQFRTPRHIIDMMVKMMAPKPYERIGDLAAGTCGFLVGAYEYILEQHTPDDVLYDEEGNIRYRTGSELDDRQREHLQNDALRGFDNDSGMTMLRIGSMNLMLHGINNPQYFYMDTLSNQYDEVQDYEVILMNPPFKGKVDKGDVNEELPSNTTKSELLFIHRILRSLEMGGRCAVIVPDGVLFGSTKAHRETRQRLVEENRLDGVISMPSGVFKPYSGVSTAVLLFTKGGDTADIWFYDMAYDGYSLDDKRTPTPSQNDIPDVLASWQQRFDGDFIAAREARLAALQAELEPLQQERLRLEGEINRLRFESVIAPEGDTSAKQALEQARQALAEVQEQMAPLKADIDQVTRQFWVSKADVKANKYDLSASRYREVQQDPVFYEEPAVTMERIRELNRVISAEIAELEEML